MRVANILRPLVVGLQLVVFQVWIPAANGWEWNPLSRNDDSDAAAAKEDDPHAAPNSISAALSSPNNGSRWRQDPSLRQASAKGTTEDNSVQQAGWANMPASTPTNRSGAANNNNGNNNGPAQRRQPQANQSSPMFHGTPLQMPQLPFTRGATSSKTPAAAQSRTASAASATTGTQSRQPMPRMAANTGRPTNPVSARLTAPGARGMNDAVPSMAPSSANSRAASPNANATAGHTSPTARTESQTKQSATRPSPQQRQAVASPTVAPSQTASKPSAKTSADSATPAAAESLSPADRLIREAHEQAAKAETEQDFSRVVETCRRARASQPSTQATHFSNDLASWALNRRGQLKAEAGRARDAQRDFDEAVELNPECWRAIHNRGVLQAQAGHLEKAFDDFNRTIQLKPDFAKAYSNRGALFVLANDLKPALQDYNQAIKLDPDLAVAHRGSGRVCHLMGRLDEAVQHYDDAVQLAPDDAFAVTSRADVLTDMGRYADALADYDQAIQLNAKATEAYRGSAWLLATCPDGSVRDAALAVERAEQAIHLDNNEDSVSFDTLAAAQASAGDFQNALDSIRHAIELAPKNERDVYQSRLLMYQRAKPYRIAPVRPVTQASYEVESSEPSARR